MTTMRQGSSAPKRVAAINDIRSMLRAGNIPGAAGAIAPLMKKSKNDAEVLYLAAFIAEAQRRLIDAREFAQRSVRLRPRTETYALIARCHRAFGETVEALAACDAALEMSPNMVAIQVIKGGTLEEAGRFDEARAIIGPLFEAGHTSKFPQLTHEWCKLLVQAKQYDEATRLIDSAIDDGVPPPLARLLLQLRAKADDRSANFARALDSATRANEVGKVQYSAELYEQQVSVLVENWSREAMADFPLSTCDSETPVFVAGMPRSGTSLIDQIIDAHPRAAGVGELSTIEQFAVKLDEVWDPDAEPSKRFGRYNHLRWSQAARDYIKEVTKQAPDAERIVNKALGNNKLVGLLARLFPKTRIIHAIRDPRDVAVSCFMGGFNNSIHAWTTQLDWALHAWTQSMRMMDHWKATLDVPILDVHYEKLVREPETQFPRIIEFLGLDWDDACKDFYKSKRTVRTLSYDQVNRPLYTTSAGRHANYASYFEGLTIPPYEPS